MELLRGEDLAALIRRFGALHATRVVRLLGQVALALDKTHAAGIVHRDLKPENLFLTQRDDGSPCIKILDFGIAKTASAVAQRNGTRMLGTPKYMAPEQIRGDGATDARADIHALGHLAYTLLCGEAYWEEEEDRSDSLYALLDVLVAGASEPASARAARRSRVSLPRAFDEWFALATARDPRGRFPRASDATAALASSLGVAPALGQGGTVRLRPAGSTDDGLRDSSLLMTSTGTWQRAGAEAAPATERAGVNTAASPRTVALDASSSNDSLVLVPPVVRKPGGAGERTQETAPSAASPRPMFSAGGGTTGAVATEVPPPPPRRSRRRRASGYAIAIGATLAALVAAAVLLSMRSGASAPAVKESTSASGLPPPSSPPAVPPTSATVVPSATASASATPPSPTPRSQPVPPPRTKAPSPPPPPSRPTQPAYEGVL